MLKDTLIIILGILVLLKYMVKVIIIIDDKKKRKHHHKLKLRVIFQSKIKHHLMASINSITLTDVQPHTGLVQVVDDLGNVYSGTLSNPVIDVADPTQDSVVIDPTTPNTIDVQEKNPQGGTTANLKMDFTSQGNATPAPGSSAQAIPDGTVFPGLAVSITMINKVSTQLKLQVSF